MGKLEIQNLFDIEEIIKVLKMSRIEGFNDRYIDIRYTWNGKEYGIGKEPCGYLYFFADDERTLEIAISNFNSNWTSCIYSKDDFYGLQIGLKGDVISYNSRKEDIDVKLDLSVASDSYETEIQIIDDDRIFVKEEDTQEDLDNSNNLMIFDEDGIRYNGYRISSDGMEVRSFKGEILPSKDELESINIPEEKEKVEKLLKNADINQFTKDNISKWLYTDGIYDDYINDILCLYDYQLPCFQEIIKFREALLNDKASNYVFTKEELKVFYGVLVNVLNNSLIESTSKKL